MWSEQEAFRAGLEVGIRATHSAWESAVMNERHMALAHMAAARRVEEMLNTLAPKTQIESNPPVASG